MRIRGIRRKGVEAGATNVPVTQETVAALFGGPEGNGLWELLLTPARWTTLWTPPSARKNPPSSRNMPSNCPGIQQFLPQAPHPERSRRTKTRLLPTPNRTGRSAPGRDTSAAGNRSARENVGARHAVPVLKWRIMLRHYKEEQNEEEKSVRHDEMNKGAERDAGRPLG